MKISKLILLCVFLILSFNNLMFSNVLERWIYGSMDHQNKIEVNYFILTDEQVSQYLVEIKNKKFFENKKRIDDFEKVKDLDHLYLFVYLNNLANKVFWGSLNFQGGSSHAKLKIELSNEPRIYIVSLKKSSEQIIQSIDDYKQLENATLEWQELFSK